MTFSPARRGDGSLRGDPMFARRRAAVGSICDIGTALIRSKKREPRRAFDLTRPREPWGVWQGTSREGEAGLAAKDSRACREPDTRSACSKCGERREPFGLSLHQRAGYGDRV